jgi:type III pantothenate kinase
MRPLLLIDVGNTRLKWALMSAARPGVELLAQGAAFLEQIETLAETQWTGLPAPVAMLGCCVAGDSVRHRVEEELNERWDLPGRWVFSSAGEAGVTNGYDQPGRLGADRFVALVGARHRHLAQVAAGTYTAPQPLLVVMVGTAVTVDAMDADGHFLGGLILPGHGIMLSALQAGTAGLKVPTGEVKAFPTNTSDALTSGGTYAIAGAIGRMVRHLREHTGAEPLVVVSGGAGWKMSPAIRQPHELVDTLVFDGLLAIAQARAESAAALGVRR